MIPFFDYDNVADKFQTFLWEYRLMIIFHDMTKLYETIDKE